MQTTFIILASIFGLISALCFSINQNILLSFGTGLVAAILYLAAFLSRDKKDKQIEEIHATLTNKDIPLLSKPEKTKKEQKPELSETHGKVLELLFDKASTVESLSKTLKLTKEETNYYLHDLYDKVMVSRPAPYASGPEQWRIGQGGREYVMTRRDSEKAARDAWNAHT